jgi:hypothetical protein
VTKCGPPTTWARPLRARAFLSHVLVKIRVSECAQPRGLWAEGIQPQCVGLSFFDGCPVSFLDSGFSMEAPFSRLQPLPIVQVTFCRPRPFPITHDQCTCAQVLEVMEKLLKRCGALNERPPELPGGSAASLFLDALQEQFICRPPAGHLFRCWACFADRRIG